MARKYDWTKPVESRIGVPFEVAQQKKALVEICSVLEEAGLDLTDLVKILERNGVHFIRNLQHQPRRQLSANI